MHSPIPSASLLELKPQSPVRTSATVLSSSPLKRLKMLPKYSGLETRTEVSCKIKGHQRRALPGHTCDKCEDVSMNFRIRAERYVDILFYIFLSIPVF